MATVNQTKLYDMMSEYAVKITAGYISHALEILGPSYVSGDAISEILLPVIEEHHNECAQRIQSRTDENINQSFDTMSSIQLDQGNMHAFIVLGHIVKMTLQLLNNMNIRDIISDDHERTIRTVTLHLESLLSDTKGMAVELYGCSTNQPVLKSGEKMFRLSVVPILATPTGDVELTGI